VTTIPEALEDYFRACAQKNITYKEIAQKINSAFGLCLTHDIIRKRYKRWCKNPAILAQKPRRMDKPTTSTDDTLQCLQKRIDELESRKSSDTQEQVVANLRATLNATERKWKEAQKQSTVTELVRETVREVVIAFPPPPEPHKFKTVDKKHEQEAVLMLCCLHMGEVVSVAETNGFGEYSMAVAQARFQSVVDSVIDLVRDHHRGERIRKLWVINLGDNVSGDIHEELSITNERPVITQTLSAAYLLALGIRDLAANFECVEMVGLPGNHGRNRKKPMHKLKAEDSFDRMTYETVGLLCANIANFTMTIPPAYWVRQVINEVPFVFLHGDNLKAWNTLPFYGAFRMNANFTTLHSTRDEYYKYLVLGHYHQNVFLPRMGGEIIFCGSLKGPDEFSLDTLQQGSEPAQLFFGVHPSRGISFRYPLNARDATAETESRYQFTLAELTLADMAKKIGLL